MSVKAYVPVATEYLFSNKKLEDFDKCEQMAIDLLADLITTHGAGGKVMEKFLEYKFGYETWSDDIHDYDSKYTDGRPIEQKMETVNKTSKLQFHGSWSKCKDHEKRKDVLYKEDGTLILNSAICKDTGKILWVTITDTKLIPYEALFWKRLGNESPRICFSQYKEYPESVEFLYVNQELCEKYRYVPSTNFCISKNVWELLIERSYINA